MKNDTAQLFMIGAIILIFLCIGTMAYFSLEYQKSGDIEPEDVLHDIIEKNEPNITENQTNTDSNKNKIIEIKEYFLQQKKEIDNITAFFKVNTTDLKIFLPAIKELNVRVFQLQNISVENVSRRYNEQMIEDEYNVTRIEVLEGKGWKGTLYFAQKGFYGRGIIIANGSIVKNILGCDVIVITSNGLLTYYEHWKEIYEEQTE